MSSLGSIQLGILPVDSRSGEPLDEKRYTARQASAYIRVLRIAIPVNLVAILLSVVTDLVSR